MNKPHLLSSLFVVVLLAFAIGFVAIKSVNATSPNSFGVANPDRLIAYQPNNVAIVSKTPENPNPNFVSTNSAMIAGNFDYFFNVIIKDASFNSPLVYVFALANRTSDISPNPNGDTVNSTAVYVQYGNWSEPNGLAYLQVGGTGVPTTYYTEFFYGDTLDFNITYLFHVYRYSETIIQCDVFGPDGSGLGTLSFPAPDNNVYTTRFVALNDLNTDLSGNITATISNFDNSLESVTSENAPPALMTDGVPFSGGIGGYVPLSFGVHNLTASPTTTWSDKHGSNTAYLSGWTINGQDEGTTSVNYDVTTPTVSVNLIYSDTPQPPSPSSTPVNHGGQGDPFTDSTTPTASPSTSSNSSPSPTLTDFQREMIVFVAVAVAVVVAILVFKTRN